MKQKLLLLVLLLCGGFLYAQDTIDYLIITEYRGDNTNSTYLELTNVGDQDVQLSDFNIGHWGGTSTLDMVTAQTPQDDYPIPVDTLLKPGESFVFAAFKEFEMRKFAEGFVEDFSERNTILDMANYADFLVHLPEEGGDSTDVVTENFYDPFSQQWGPGMNGFYIEYHFTDANGLPDSAVVDQVLGMFTDDDGTQLDRTQGEGYDVAGVTLATGNSHLIRNAKVTKGNLDFNGARGIDLTDSEWIPIPINSGFWRDVPWTVGNHGNFVLDASTLESDVVSVDFANKTLTVPWGVRRGDHLMHQFNRKPGVGWTYLVPEGVADTLTTAVQTGDQLVIYVCGETLTTATFDIVAADPSASATTVVPKVNKNVDEPVESILSGILNWPRITEHGGSRDTITGFTDGIPFATRVDSLLNLLHKPSNASWEVVYAGLAKPDLTEGDMIKVTASDGTEKEYYIAERTYIPSHEARLSSITWPDIPEFFRGLFGWMGDTIPNFGAGVNNYSVTMPPTTKAIPAMVAKPLDINASVKTIRPVSLAGSEADRTMTFEVTAEDDTSNVDYNVIITVQKDPAKLQPYNADPIISEMVINMGWQSNDGLEIFNPGNQVLDLSNYMIVGTGTASPVEAISAENVWLDRYEKYIPGYKWQDTTAWNAKQYIAVPDLSVNKMLDPGDVFTMVEISNGPWGNWSRDDAPPYPFEVQADVQFKSFQNDDWTFENQWGEDVNTTLLDGPRWKPVFVFKITGDSILTGEKPATDPADFELVDMIGMADGSRFKLGGYQPGTPQTSFRKPWVYKGNTNIGESMGTTPEDTEWSYYELSYWAGLGYGWPYRMWNILSDFGKHYMITPTHYMSTVTSLVYKVSEGYSLEETIRGITTGSTVSDAMANITKADTGQVLMVTATANGDTLAVDGLLSNNDTLTVISSNGENMTKYILEVTDEGLNGDALLTSSTYTIDVSTQPDGATLGEATISGFDYSADLKDVVDGVTLPAGASMSMIDDRGSYVTFTTLTFDTTYIDVKVNDKIFFEVIAENGVTGILYQLTPDIEDGALFVTSNIYEIDQDNMIIGLVPKTIGLKSFLSYLIPSPGATIKVQDKAGFDRTSGFVADDDRIIVTSADGETSIVYYLSKLETNQQLFLAYIRSDIYAISQIDFLIDGVPENATVEDFMANVVLAPEATMAIIDDSGNERTTGMLANTDRVVVTSGDGSLEVSYSFGTFVVGVKQINVVDIQLYPNPSDGRLNIRGLEAGQAVHVYNAYGARVVDQEATGDIEVVSISNHPSGVYMIVVLDDAGQVIGKYKAVKY